MTTFADRIDRQFDGHRNEDVIVATMNIVQAESLLGDLVQAVASATEARRRAANERLAAAKDRLTQAHNEVASLIVDVAKMEKQATGGGARETEKG